MPVRFSLFLINVEVTVVTARKEEVEGAETHEMDILRPRASRVASSLRSLSTGQDINDAAQPVISRVEGLTSIAFAVASRDNYFILLQDPGEAASLR